MKDLAFTFRLQRFSLQFCLVLVLAGLCMSAVTDNQTSGWLNDQTETGSLLLLMDSDDDLDEAIVPSRQPQLDLHKYFSQLYYHAPSLSSWALTANPRAPPKA